MLCRMKCPKRKYDVVSKNSFIHSGQTSGLKQREKPGLIINSQDKMSNIAQTILALSWGLLFASTLMYFLVKNECFVTAAGQFSRP